MEFFVQFGCCFAACKRASRQRFRGFAGAAKIGEAFWKRCWRLIFVWRQSHAEEYRAWAGVHRERPVIVIQSRDPISLFFECESEVQARLQFLWRDGKLLCIQQCRNRVVEPPALARRS